MKTYYLRQLYFATGEGISSFIAVGQAMSELEFLKGCENRGMDSYYLNEPLVLTEIVNLSEDEMTIIKSDFPKLYKQIINKQYEVGVFWWTWTEHINMS